uniref:Uncharacterized protein n=1 Tax=Ditylenchus dipsaci TaxID=166011 RepID=A0A915EFA8_9BILA
MRPNYQPIVHTEELVDQRAATLNEMDAELHAKERLAEVYKTSLESANNEIFNLKHSEVEIQSTLQEGERSELFCLNR